VGSYVGDCFTVAIIAFSVCISLSKIFAKKHNYEVDANQELLAYGLSNFVSSFFLCYPAASSLSRSAVQDSMNGKTQLAGLISCCILLLVLLVIGPLFQSVPRCCLAAIILVALKGMFIHVKELPKLWHLSQWDSWTWIITALATIILDVDYGLVIGVAFSILSVIFRTQAPTSHLLGRIPKTDIYKNVDAYSTVEEVEGVKIFRYEGSVYYACCEHFRESIYTKTLYNPQKILIEIKSLQSKLAAWDERWKKRIKKDIPTSETRLTNIPDSQEMTVASTDPEKPYSTESYAINTEEYHLLIKRQKYEDRLRALTNIPIHHIIIDASTWGFIDHAAVLTLCQIFTEYELIDVTVFLANPKSDIREMLGRSDFQNDDCIYVTVHDAVMEALHEHKLSLVLNSASKRKLTRKKEAK
jgi:MFS superfamily sulfate permease-like transporter